MRDTAIDRRRRFVAEEALDQVLADSFPASDPPSWTLGLARTASAGVAARAESALKTLPEPMDVEPLEVRVIDAGERGFLWGVTSLAGAAGMALLVPVAILLVGLPVALVVRGILEAIGWLLSSS